eukprot:4469384-Pyramimonas_sp.AAC.1
MLQAAMLHAIVYERRVPHFLISDRTSLVLKLYVSFGQSRQMSRCLVNIWFRAGLEVAKRDA